MGCRPAGRQVSVENGNTSSLDVRIFICQRNGAMWKMLEGPPAFSRMQMSHWGVKCEDFREFIQTELLFALRVFFCKQGRIIKIPRVL